MERLLIIADDFTGALDTGVQFTDRGAETQVVMDPDVDFSTFDDKVKVIVVNLESRHVPPIDAYRLVYKTVVKATAAGIRYIYKKTDSGLRGNIGAELTAVIDGAGADSLMFIPAFPRNNRNTMSGVHYIDGVPVAESMFGNDPVDPVTKSRVSDIIHIQSGTPCFEHAANSTTFPEDLNGIHIFDASSNEDLQAIAEGLGKERLHFSAGCAGFAAALAQELGLAGVKPQFPELPTNIFMACGSVNPITIAQMKNGERAGYTHLHLTAQQKLDTRWPRSADAEPVIDGWIKTANSTGKFIMDANEPEGRDELSAYMQAHDMDFSEVYKTIAPQIGRITRVLLDRGLDATLLCTGGDTLVALMREVGVNALRPISEISTGCVLTSFEYNGKLQYVITKSGGFGTPDVLIKLGERISATNAARS